ncbi:MAG: diguanylate cyclase, partial [Planctomycetes bacterium]|nr:diguanylate cyclase [Planctomycetota bacterium]
MTIATKLRLNTLLVLTFLLVNAAVGTYLVQRMMADARRLAEIDEPLEQAILEMEINARETTQVLFDFVWDHDEENIERMHDSERDFERYARQFDRLAETDETRALGFQVAELYRRFKILGDEIVSISRQRHKDLRLLREDFDQIDELIDENFDLAHEALQHMVQPLAVVEGRHRADFSRVDASTKFRTALDMEIIIHDMVGAISKYVQEQDPGVKRKIVISEADFGRSITQYRETRLSADEVESLNRIGSYFSEVAMAGSSIVSLTDQIHVLMGKFEEHRDEIDRILDDEIRVLIHAETDRAKRDAQRSGMIAIAFMLGAGFFIFVAVAGAGWIVTKGIVDATRRLSEGATQFSRGNLDHRIDMKTRDELGMVSRAFDQMADSLRQTTASRDEVIAASRARELVEEELRRSNTTLIKAVEDEKRAKSQRLAAIDELEIAATTDSLTGLCNRAVFMNRLDETMRRSSRDGSRFAVLFFDFDRFKVVNDGLGHEVGDALLRSVARVFRNSVREPDMVARFGGDEFVVLLDCMSEWSEGEERAQRLLHEFAEPHDVAGHRIVSTASIG